VEDVLGRLLGAWLVTSYEERPSADEPWAPVYGHDVAGLIVYDGSGWFSTSVAGDGRYDSYFGRFELVGVTTGPDGDHGTIEYGVVASDIPDLLLADRRQPFRLRQDCLVLGDGELWRRVCTRAVLGTEL
jgi:hypothetical protein